MTHQPSWDDWNRWCDRRIAAALAEQEAVMLETTGQALGEIRAQLREEIAAAVGELRAEITVQRAAEKADDVIIELPNPLRRRGNGAA